MLFNGVDIYCSFDSIEVKSGYLAFDVNIRPTYIDATLVGSKYTILSLYGGAVTLYIGELSGSSASLIIKLVTADDIQFVSKNLATSQMLNKSISVGFIYKKDGYSFTVNGTVVSSATKPMPPLDLSTGTQCYIGGYPRNGKINDSFYGYIDIVTMDAIEYVTVDDVVTEQRVPLARVNLNTQVIADYRGIGIPFDLPQDALVRVHGIVADINPYFPLDRDIIKEAYTYGDGDLPFYITRQVTNVLSGDNYVFGVDRVLAVGNNNQFGINRTAYYKMKYRYDIGRLVVKRDSILVFELVNGNFTTGGLDGSLISINTGINPAKADKTRARYEFSNPIRIGVRCISNHIARSGVLITPEGILKNKWQLALDINGKPGVFGKDGAPLRIDKPIDDSNFPFWIRFRTDFNRKLYDDTTNFRVTGSVENMSYSTS